LNSVFGNAKGVINKSTEISYNTAGTTIAWMHDIVGRAWPSAHAEHGAVKCI